MNSINTKTSGTLDCTTSPPPQATGITSHLDHLESVIRRWFIKQDWNEYNIYGNLERVNDKVLHFNVLNGFNLQFGKKEVMNSVWNLSVLPAPVHPHTRSWNLLYSNIDVIQPFGIERRVTEDMETRMGTFWSNPQLQMSNNALSKHEQSGEGKPYFLMGRVFQDGDLEWMYNVRLAKRWMMELGGLSIQKGTSNVLVEVGDS
jgi:hypothetical protein